MSAERPGKMPRGARYRKRNVRPRSQSYMSPHMRGSTLNRPRASTNW